MNRSQLILKLRLMTEGIRLTASAKAAIARLKPPIRTRSGVSGGLDLVLADDIHVNCPVDEVFARTSALSLDFDAEAFFIRENQTAPVRASVYPRPAFYSEFASDGTPYVEIGQMCSGDRICIGMTRHCVFWKDEDRCHFCSIGHNAPREAMYKTAKNIAETVAVAASDTVLPARHVLIGGGTPNQEDRGAAFASEATMAIKKLVDLSVYVMIAPPSDLDDIARVHDSGADELGMNLEFFSEDAMRAYAPGKLRHIGRAHHYRALERAVKLFGSISTRSIVIVGLESPEQTIAGAERLAQMGVMPILSPFRPLEGSRLETAAGFSPSLLADIYYDVAARCRPYGIAPGPTCIPCQNNTLASPEDVGMRYYGKPWPGVRLLDAAAQPTVG